MSLYTTQFQGPVMAATREQSCLKLTFVLLAIGYTNSNRVGAVVSLPG